MVMLNNNRVSVLVVDDEPNIRLMLQTVLESEGYRVEQAGNGQEAIDKLATRKFDLMLLDLNMPVLDGMGALQKLRDESPDRFPRVIVLTAFGSIATAVRATRLGALDFLEKPASPVEIREAVTAVLNEPQPAREEPTESDTAGGYAQVLDRVRQMLRSDDVGGAESLLIKAADLAEHDAAYFNLLGVIYETRGQWRLAKKMYGKAIRCDKRYEPSQQNMRRIYELYTFGHSKSAVALGDENNSALAALLKETQT